MKSPTKLSIFLITLLLVSLACSSNTNWLPNNTLPNSDLVVDDSSQNDNSLTAIEQSPNDLTSIEYSLMAVYEKAYPSVVSILVMDENGNGGSGSGFVIDMDGHIVTNLHVVQNAIELQVSFPSGLKARGEVIGTDKDSDLAIIEVNVDEKYLFPIVLGNSDNLRVGQIVVAIGSPFNLDGTMTYGIVSNIGRTMPNSLNVTPNGGNYSAGELIQTDAAINPGNSGGPLINLAGEVVGINRAIRTYNTNAENEPINSGIAFAISVNILNTVLSDLIEFGKYDYPLLGISSLGGDMPLSIAEDLGLELAIGVLVTSVSNGGPAEDAGVLPGDVINQIDEQEIRNFGDLLTYLFIQTSPGDTANIHVFRDGKTIVLPLIIGVRP